MTLSMTAEFSLQAQSPAAAPVLIASEGITGDFFPGALASSHAALSAGLAVTPAISQALPKAPALVEPAAGPLTAKDRLILFWNESYAAPGTFVGIAGGAWVDQVRHTPAKWDGDGSSYTRRFASEYGQLATRNLIHDGLAAMTGLDPRYVACQCTGTMRRSAHALKRSFVTYRQDGQVTLDVPQIASAYGSGIVSTFWYPHQQFRPLVQGVQFGHQQMGEIVVSNLVQEFVPDIQRRLHWHSLTARRTARADDDD